MSIIIAIVTAATLWPALLSAAEGDRETKWKRDIAACVQTVRTLNQYGDFDAYVTPRGAVRYFGTAQERFQFEKCMVEKGWDLDK